MPERSRKALEKEKNLKQREKKLMKILGLWWQKMVPRGAAICQKLDSDDGLIISHNCEDQLYSIWL